MMTGNYDILLKYSLGEITSAQAMRRLHVNDEQSLNKLTLDANLPLPRLSDKETEVMSKRFGELLDKAGVKATVKLEPWYLVEGANKILCKHQFHKAQDQMFTYNADKETKELFVHVDELDIMLLKWFLFIHAPSLIDEDLAKIDDYKIIITVRDDSCAFLTRLYRSEHDWQQDTVVLTPITLVDDIDKVKDAYREKYIKDFEAGKITAEAGFAMMKDVAKNSTVTYPDDVDFEINKE